MNEKIFNLIDEPWIKVLDQESNTIEVSLKELFENAHLYTRLAGETPTQDAAIFRILLAIEITVFYRFCMEGEEDPILDYEEPEICVMNRWKEYWNAGKFNGKVFAQYLEKYKERFYLFHPETPFWQVPDMDEGTEYGVKCLLGNMKESNNKATYHHFSMTDGKYLDSLEYAEIARWLIYQNAYSVNVKTKVNNQNIPTKVGRLGQLGLIIIREDNLFKELMINMCPLKNGRIIWGEPKPAWEKDVCMVPGREIAAPDNLPELYTIQSRRIKLLFNKDKKLEGYKAIGGDYYDTENDPTEQMTVMQKIQAKKGENEKIVPKLHNRNIEAWREIPSLLRDSEVKPGVIEWIILLCKNKMIDSRKIITVKTIGLEYGDGMSYTNGNIISDSLSMATDLLTDLGSAWIVRVNNQIDKCMDVRSKMFYKFAVEVSKILYKSDKQKTSMITNKLERRFYFLIDTEFRVWLESINPRENDIDVKEREWEDTAYYLARQVVEEYISNMSIQKAIEISKTANACYSSLRSIYKINKTEGGDKNE